MASGGTYSAGEFVKMQDDAVRRAREMSRRSTSPANSPRRCPQCGRELTADGRHVGEALGGKPAKAETAGAPPRSSAGASSPRQKSNEATDKFTPPPSHNSSAQGSAPPHNTGGRSPLFQLFGGESSEGASKLNIPFLGDINIDRDFIIIGGVLLTLLGEETDRFLLMALVYIML